MNKQLCTECNDNYYQIENNPLNTNENFDCYREPKGYYYDSIDSLYKKCFYTCENCEIKGDNKTHNCLECNTEYSFKINFNNYTNCYRKCDYNYYFDNNNNYHCTIDLSCPNEYPKLIEDKNECIFENALNFDNIIEDILNFEKNKTQEGKEQEINIYNEVLKKIESFFTSNNYNLEYIDKGEDQIIQAEKILITFTTTKNQKNNIDSNMTTIDLSDCEELLRNYYNLTNNETIYMKKIDIIQDGMTAKKIEYDVYRKLSENNLEKLNLSVCRNAKISINIPLEINGNIDKLNTSSGYFNEICYTATTDDGTDISLNDRKNEYIKGDNIICQEDCIFSEYDFNLKKAKCECFAKDSSSSFAEMNINKNKLFENLIDIKNLVNLNILVCYKMLLNCKNIFHNIGSLIMISIFIFHIISIFIFYIKQLHNIIQIVKNIIFGITNKNFIKQEKIKKNNQIKPQKRNIKDNIIINYNYKKKVMKFEQLRNKKNFKYFENKNQNKSNSNNKIILNNNYYYIKNKINIKPNVMSKKKINRDREFLNLNNQKQNEIEKIKKLMNYNNDELNELSYNLALIYDKRTYCQYYGVILKSKHSLIFTFCNNEDYNSKIIKIDLFLIEFTINYVVNALFFNDETMHKIYVNKGAFNLETQIPLTIYSSLISMILDTPLAFLALSNDSIINFKQNKPIGNSRKIGKKLSFCLKVKFVLYFILSFIFQLFFLVLYINVWSYI